MNEAYDKFLKMQINFSYGVVQNIFANDHDHYWNKWVSSNDNIILFISKLDNINRMLVLDWGSHL